MKSDNLLLILANRLTEVSFSDALPVPAKVHNVTNSWNAALWRVRLRLEGVPRVIGLTKSLPTALRFADMALVYLSDNGYRRNFTLDGLNYSAEQARQDATHPVAGPLLGEIITYLFPNGAPAKRIPAKRITLKSRMAKLELDIAGWKAKVEFDMAALCAKLDGK